MTQNYIADAQKIIKDQKISEKERAIKFQALVNHLAGDNSISLDEKKAIAQGITQLMTKKGPVIRTPSASERFVETFKQDYQNQKTQYENASAKEDVNELKPK